MNTTNEQIHDDVQEIRDELPAPDERKYTLRVMRNYVRVEYDGDPAFSSSMVRKAFHERGYTYGGASFARKIEAWEPPGDADE